ncbi:hypothetical protein V5O48_006428 [Marasmius crinis-equi]|uniref:Uncharacterized protein n=1 Tax=Marasmius crinis-equi TaxID=585013 RepID=A0ABR3FK63_9AGAR
MSSTEPTSRVTRHKKIEIDNSLKKHTREELRVISDTKKQEKAEQKRLAKEEKARQTSEKKQRLTSSGKALAKFEDKQAPSLAQRSSLRPDLKAPKKRRKSPASSPTPKSITKPVDEGLVLSDDGGEQAPTPKKTGVHNPPKGKKDHDTDKTSIADGITGLTPEKYAAFMAWEQEQETRAKKDQQIARRKENTEKRKVRTIQFADDADEDMPIPLLTQAERKSEKSIVRDVVVEHRTTTTPPAVPMVEGSKKQRKRSLTNGKEEDTNAGNAKKQRIDRPVADDDSSEAESSDSASESDSDSSGPELVAGSFDADEAPAVVAAARDSKKLKKILRTGKATKTLPENPVLKSLVPADVIDIDTKEAQANPAPLETPKTSSRQSVGVKSLPFPADDFVFYKQKWETQVVPFFLVFAESQRLQFGVGNDSQFAALVVARWKKVFPELKNNSNDKIILQVARSDLRQYRTNVAKEAIKIVERKVKEAGNTDAQRAEWVKRQRRNDSFLYEIPGPTHAESSGLLRGPGPSETLAYHLNLTATIERQNTPDFKIPSGAIALCAAAYQRALEIFEPGYNRVEANLKIEKAKLAAEGKKKKISKKSDYSFTEGKWDKRVSQLFDITAGAKWSKWRQFEEQAKKFLPNHDIMEASPHSSVEDDGDDEDDEAHLLLSSEA